MRQNVLLLHLLSLTAAILPNSVDSLSENNNDCACGYSLNTTASASYAVFTEILETDFTHTYYINSSLNPCWTPQQYEVSAGGSHGPFGKSANISNVVPNPYSSWSSWSGSGKDGINEAGLQLWVDAVPINISSGLAIKMGEIASKRGDIVYGTFRVGMRLTGTPGTCGAFFYFRNNSQEIDMEFLSANITSGSNPVYLVMQTPESVAQGYNAAGTSTFEVDQLGFDPADGLHEYRFDWVPNRVSFYADGRWIQDLDWQYPNAPGHLSINHWSNGNPLWSGGPPAVDAVLTVAYMKAYFNSTDPTRYKEYAQQCSKSSDMGRICEITDAVGFPNASNHFGVWYGRGMCGETVNSSSVQSPTSTMTATPTSGATSIFNKSSNQNTVNGPWWFHKSACVLQHVIAGYSLFLVMLLVIDASITIV